MNVQAALNGNRTDLIVPRMKEEIVTAAQACVEAGATSIHVHPRDATGAETLQGQWMDAQVAALRTAVPSIPIGVSTGAWIEPDLAARLACIRSWTELPDFASVNFDEAGCEAVADLLTKRGIFIEAGLCDRGAAERLVAYDNLSGILRVLIEPQEADYESAIKTVTDIEDALERTGIILPRLLHGVDATVWPLVRTAAERGYATRMGFEDTLLLPDGQPAVSNAELLRAGWSPPPYTR